MNHIKFSLVLVVSFFLVSTVITHTASAQCSVVGSTPGGGQEVVCNGNDPDGVTTTDLGDIVTMNPGSSVDGQVRIRDGNDIFNMTDASINNNSIAITDSGGNDEMNIKSSSIFTSSGDCINASSGDDTVKLEYADLNCGGSGGINGASGMDTVYVSNVEISANINSINTASDDDNITIGDNVLLTSGGAGINCGGDFDILTFAMTVPPHQVATLTAQLAAADPSGGSITINGILLEWTSCEVLVADFQDPEPRPIPTLSEWGLIAMAGALGIFGAFYMMRRRQTT